MIERTSRRLGIRFSNGICHHRCVLPVALLAQQSEYLITGVLTVIAAVIVTAVILISSRSDTGGR
jgi:hypothetical protein